MSIEQDNTNKQMKKLIIAISSLLVLSVLLLYSLGIFRLPQTKVDGFEAVPQNTAAVLAFKNYEESSDKLAQMEYMPTLSKLQLVKKFQNEIALIDSLSSQTNFQNSLTDTRLFISLHSGSATRLDFLYIFDNFSNTISLEDLLAQAPIHGVKKDTRANYTIFEVAATKTETFFLSFKSS